MDAIDRFASEASLFEQWARQGTDEGDLAAREALVRITRMYVAALDLPQPWSEELSSQSVAERVGHEEWRAVLVACARLPLQHYAEMFDPLPIPPEAPVIGSLADDIADIYRDVVTGLREHQDGRRANAIWEWVFGFQHHWGAHATGAIRALHCWLADNAAQKLTTNARLDP